MKNMAIQTEKAAEDKRVSDAAIAKNNKEVNDLLTESENLKTNKLNLENELDKKKKEEARLIKELDEAKLGR